MNNKKKFNLEFCLATPESLHIFPPNNFFTLYLVEVILLFFTCHTFASFLTQLTPWNVDPVSSCDCEGEIGCVASIVTPMSASDSYSSSSDEL